jgi:hypothetical protein
MTEKSPHPSEYEFTDLALIGRGITVLKKQYEKFSALEKIIRTMTPSDSIEAELYEAYRQQKLDYEFQPPGDGKKQFTKKFSEPFIVVPADIRPRFEALLELESRITLQFSELVADAADLYVELRDFLQDHSQTPALADYETLIDSVLDTIIEMQDGLPGYVELSHLVAVLKSVTTTKRDW